MANKYKLYFSIGGKPVFAFNDFETVSDIYDMLETVDDSDIESGNVSLLIKPLGEVLESVKYNENSKMYDIFDESGDILLVSVKVDKDTGDIKAIPADTGDFYDESVEIANKAIKRYFNGKNLDKVLKKIDNDLNYYQDNFRYSRLIPSKSNGLDVMTSLAAQTLSTLRDDLMRYASKPSTTVEDLKNKYLSLTGVDFDTDEIYTGDIDVTIPYVDDSGKLVKEEVKINGLDQYEHLLGLNLKDINDIESYDLPENNKFIQTLKDYTKDLIDKYKIENRKK